ncbi:MAG: long-chain-fatty-acid--CoA ligase [Saccharolobus sp.]|uniref:long-chain-fatty-acid--CoA ligase n=1 Tax=Saccharolobus TaxID=2100760 RepID=UPI001F0E9113|nr:long-chain-fatty-acid--CoA ligase [Saccharolobus shibatae]
MEIIKGFPSTMMDDYQLNVVQILEHAGKWYGEQEIVSRRKDNIIIRYNYREALRRVKKLANSLKSLDVRVGDRVGVLEWNTHRFYELYFAIPATGAVMLELNPRLHPLQLAKIINHSKVSFLFLNEDFIPLIESISNNIPSVKKFIVISDTEKKHQTNYYDYEKLVEGGDEKYEIPMFDERTACYAAYTTGTTGDPKGIYYSHRSIVLNTLVISRNITIDDTFMQLVPMFHVNGWLGFMATTLVGAKLVLPGRYTADNPKPLVDLMISEKVTVTAGVPEVFSSILNYLRNMENKPLFVNSRILIGGSEPPLSLVIGLMEFGFQVGQGYGATETTPSVAGSVVKPKIREKYSDKDMLDLLRKQGIPAFGINIKVVDPSTGEEVPHDGKTVGELWIRGPWIASSYYNDPRTMESFVGDGVDRWWRSGDLAVVDELGYIKIVDRIKDVIKSGGEWISTVDLENHLMTHPAVAEATVIGIPHPKWGERPLAFVVLRQGFENRVSKEELLGHLSQRFAKWQLPDDIIFVKEIPKTSVGKFDKKVLREKYRDFFTSGRKESI